jgi:hypothetical protein
VYGVANHEGTAHPAQVFKILSIPRSSFVVLRLVSNYSQHLHAALTAAYSEDAEIKFCPM